MRCILEFVRLEHGFFNHYSSVSCYRQCIPGVVHAFVLSAMQKFFLAYTPLEQ